jgi:heavy metal sensor kinase
MKSIRLSLVVYFLVLLTVALGAVYWLVDHLAADALDQRLQDSKQLVHTQYKTHCDEVLSGLDRRLLRQAHYVAAMARAPLHLEGLYPFGAPGVAFTAQPHLHVGLWLNSGIPPRSREPKEPALSEQLFRLQSLLVDIEAAEALMPAGTKHEDLGMDNAEVPGPAAQSAEQAREFFQAFYGAHQPISRSQSLGSQSLPVDPRVLRELAGKQPHEGFYFETVERGPDGRAVRQVTLLAFFKRGRPGGNNLAAPWIWWQTKAPGKGPVFTKMDGPQSFPGTPVFGTSIFVQYAIDLAPTEARLKQYAVERDQQLAQLASDTESQLDALRRQLLWIAIATFAATLAGGYLLLRLGLAPIGRLSDAVSEVSERDFRLKIEPARLPSELQPIAERLSRTLVQLGQAFDREKQAAADISHELRTPLAALMTTLEVALRKSRTAQEYREILEECRGSGAQMSQMVERLLALARLDAGADRVRPRQFDAAEVALKCADLVRPLALARGLTFTTHVEPPLPVQADPDKLREVVTNLLHNAVEYNRPGGAIDLTVSRQADALCVEVRDTGIGISLEAQAHIFERFFRADPSRHADTPHAGLGLAIVKSYVDLLKGTITVESVPQVGTTFHVRLPVPEVVMEPTLEVA